MTEHTPATPTPEDSPSRVMRIMFDTHHEARERLARLAHAMFRFGYNPAIPREERKEKAQEIAAQQEKVVSDYRQQQAQAVDILRSVAPDLATFVSCMVIPWVDPQDKAASLAAALDELRSARTTAAGLDHPSTERLLEYLDESIQVLEQDQAASSS